MGSADLFVLEWLYYLQMTYSNTVKSFKVYFTFILIWWYDGKTYETLNDITIYRNLHFGSGTLY